MSVVYEYDVKDIKLPRPYERFIKIFASPERGAKSLVSKYATFGATIIYPHTTAHPKHAHPTSEEILYVASGKGKAIIGEETFKVHPGVIIYVPPGTKHSFINESSETMKLLWIYAPPGAEKKIIDYAKTGKGYE
ncbi:MAG: cupin domain-containing protein [Candidatus Bathyarchaeia archaeon]